MNFQGLGSKYDDICGHVRDMTHASGALVIIVGGNKGSGFSCHGERELMTQLPDLLEYIASQIRGDLRH